MRKAKKTVAAFLCIAMLFGICPCRINIDELITFKAYAAEFSDDDFTYIYDVDSDGNATITGVYPLNDTDTLNIPESIDGYTVVGIDYLHMDYDDYKSIVKVVIPSTVKTVSAYAFVECPYVTELTIKSKEWNDISVSMSALRVLNIESGPEKIENGSISSNNVLRVNYNGKKLINVFHSKHISQLNIGAGVEEIDSDFEGRNIEKISVDSDNQNFSSDSYGVLFNKDKTKFYVYPGLSAETLYELPEGVTSIDSFYAKFLKYLTIPSTVKEIDSSAFRGNPRLEIVEGCNGLEFLGGFAFSDCPELRKVTLPDRQIQLGNNVFDGTFIYNNNDVAGNGKQIWIDGILYVYNHAVAYDGVSTNISFRAGTKSVANSLCKDSDFVKYIYIPNSVGYLGRSAFENCDYIENVTIPGSVKKIGRNAYANCDSLDSVVIKYGVEYIDSQAFKGCPYLTSVSIPNSVKTISYEVFADCVRLSEINVPESVEQFGNDIFKNTKRFNDSYYWSNGALYINNCLVSVNNSVSGTYTIKNGTKQICAGAFQNATNVRKAVIPSGMTVIPVGTFGMSNIETVDIPDSVTRIEESAFYGCENLKEFIIPESIIYIGRMAFAFCPNLKSVTIPESVDEIAIQAFGYSGLTDITLPYGVTEIGGQTFYRCENLKSITATGSLKKVGFEAFYGCNKLSTVNFEGTEAQWNRIFVDTGNEKFTHADVNYIVELSVSVTPFFTVLLTGKSTTLTAAVLPEGASDYTLEWSSGNKKVATVNSNGVVTAISGGFATIKATIKETGASDSCIVFVPIIDFSGEFDFSEINMATNMSRSDPEGCDGTVNSGGNSQKATAYLARWDGAVLEENDPYPSGGKIFGYTEVDADYHVQEVLWLPDRTDSLDNNTIKQAIMEYGAVYASFDTIDSCFNYTNTTYYKPEYLYTEEGHAIAIVGWDDNYSKGNFVYRPKGNGAFICKNSWGTDSGEDGYFYISYYDSTIGKRGTMAVFNNLESKTNYNKIYQYDPLGAIGWYELGAEAWGANVFPENGKTLSNDEELCAVSFYTSDKKTSYEVYVVKNYTGTSSLANDKELVSSGVIDYAGYHTVTFEPVSLKAGTRFAVVVKLIEVDGASALYLEYPLQNPKYPEQGYSKARANRGESFYSYGGTSWYDPNARDESENINICIKAFTDTVENTNVLTAAIDNEKREYESEMVYTCAEAMNAGISINSEYINTSNGDAATSSENSDEYATGSVISPVDIGNNDVYFASGISFPSYYNLVDEECVTPVKDQGNYGTCWTFASYASLESCLLKKGKGTAERSEGMSATDEIDAIVNASSANLISFDFELRELDIILGEKYQLELTANPINVKVPNVIWKSSNPNVVSVNSNGLIEAKAIGNATITVTEIDGDIQATCNIAVKEKTYAVTWNIDGTETKQVYREGDAIVAPTVPLKNGYTFAGWTPAVPTTMPAYDLSFTAVFEKNPEVSIDIRTPSATTISYGDSIILHADIAGTLPAGAYIEWTVNNDNFSRSVSDNGTKITISPNKSGSTTITATVYDAEGNEISSDTQTMTSKAGFFDKIIAFFKKLFGLTKVIPQSLKYIY